MSRLLVNQPDPDAIVAALSDEVVHYALLAELRFLSGTVYLSNQQGEFTDALWGNTWRGLGDLVGMSDVSGGPDDLAPYREYLLGIPYDLLSDESEPTRASARIPALIGNPGEYRNREAILYLQMFSTVTEDAHGRPAMIGHPIALDVSLMSDVSWSYSPDLAVLKLKVEGLLSRKGAPLYGFLTDRNQKNRHPGDNGLNYVTEVMSTQFKWTNW